MCAVCKCARRLMKNERCPRRRDVRARHVDAASKTKLKASPHRPSATRGQRRFAADANAEITKYEFPCEVSNGGGGLAVSRLGKFAGERILVERPRSC